MSLSWLLDFEREFSYQKSRSRLYSLLEMFRNSGVHCLVHSSYWKRIKHSPYYLTVTCHTLL